MKNLSMNNMNSLERMEWEFDNNLPMSQRERLAMTEVYRLKKEMENSVKETVAKDRPRVTKDS
jgi:hypothetical protein